MDKKNYNDHVISDNTKAKLVKFNEARENFDVALSALMDANPEEVTILDRLIDDHNDILDDVRKSLRGEATELDITELSRIDIDGFSIQKKWSSWYVVEQFVELAKACGMYDSAVAEGVIQEVTKINGKTAPEWIRKNSLENQFEVALDGKELTPAVSGPKELLPLGSEKK